MRKISIVATSIILLTLTVLTAFAQTSQSREDILKEIDAKRAELAALEKHFLSPTEEDKATYAEFLRQRDTGLIRLLPREKYDTYKPDATDKGLTTRGGGAYYSFTRLTHDYGYGSDIELAQGYLSTGFAGANYGIMTNLGDVPLENLGIASAAFLANHVPAEDEPKARIEQRKWGEGAMADGSSYRERLLLKKNSTYLVRSINYESSDVLVAFRVVRVDDDDSAIILWKLLKKYPTPRLARN